jgi:hypothetical protein
MFNRRTLFIIGAGASKEINLPTGIELATKIAQMLDIREEGGTAISGNYDQSLFS